MCSSGQCQTCESNAISGLFDCENVFSGDVDQIANCQRDCFDYYACTSNADCPADQPTCFIVVEGYCVSECNITALPGAAGSCPDIPEGYILSGPQLCARTNQEAPNTICESCAGITSAADCETVYAAPPLNQEADVVANCQRSCFEYYACTSDADCQDVPRPLAQVCTSGVCTDIDECVSNADCPADRPLCERGECLCGTNADCPADRPLCESGQCLAECGTNADCPADRPICNAGQCEISVFSPLDGMGGGSSA